jgi:hypothetical protein
MKKEAITSGCAPTAYCPGGTVSRGDVAIFIMRALFNQLLPAGAPALSSATPTAVARGSSATVTLTGINTHFLQGTTSVNSIPGIGITNVTVTSPTSLTAQVAVDSGAALKPISFVAITGSEEAVLPNAVVVQ